LKTSQKALNKSMKATKKVKVAQALMAAAQETNRKKSLKADFKLVF